MISPSSDTIRTFLHVLAACIWVGGQFTLAGLVPGLRAISPEAPRTVARRFNRIAWPAFGVLVVTGIWNVASVNVGDTSTEYQVTLFIKLFVVALSGVAAFAHSTSKNKAMLAVGGAVAGLGALAALFLGVLLGNA